MSKLARKSKHYQLYRSLQWFFFVAEKYFGVELNDQLIESFNLNKMKIVGTIINENFLYHSEQNNFRYLLLKNLTKDKLSTAFSYNSKWFLRKF